jgi:hypothetical protein
LGTTILYVWSYFALFNADKLPVCQCMRANKSDSLPH